MLTDLVPDRDSNRQVESFIPDSTRPNLPKSDNIPIPGWSFTHFSNDGFLLGEGSALESFIEDSLREVSCYVAISLSFPDANWRGARKPRHLIVGPAYPRMKLA